MPKNHWYIACATAQLDADKPRAASILDEKLVVFRDADGKPQALKDRCCHRGLPLSQGKVTATGVQCGFHGWTYDGTGQCRRIPSQPPEKAIAAAFRVPSFPCEEKDGYIWVWMGEEASGPLPTISEFATTRWIQGSRIVNCHYLRALEITFDIAHVYFLHPTHPATIAAAKHGLKPDTSELRLTEQGCVFFSPPTEDASAPIPNQAGLMEFLLPGRVRFAWPTAGGSCYYMNFHVIPIGERQCRIEFLVQNFDPDGAPVLWSDGPSPIMDEDVVALEAIQTIYDTEGESFERSVEADAPLLMLRRILKLASDGKWRGLETDLPRRRLVSAMVPVRYDF